MIRLGFKHKDLRNKLLSNLNQKVLFKIVDNILFINFFIESNLIYIKRKLRNLFINKKKFLNDQSLKKREFELEQHRINAQRSTLINRRHIFITEIISDPRNIRSNHFFIRSNNAITSFVPFVNQKFDPLFLTALELIQNPNILYKESYLFKHLNKLKDNNQEKKFKYAHGLSVLINFVQMIGLIYLLI